MQGQEPSSFTSTEHETWAKLFKGLAHCRAQQAHPLFASGLDALEITAAGIPSLNAVNERLYKRTGWKGVLVAGLEDNTSFFRRLARREFPIGNFIRDARDINYTPAPDIFHDLYGHLPLLADADYADFIYRFGVAAMRYVNDPQLFEQFGRLFWFGVEFPLIKYGGEVRIFGGGILSSRGECDYCLSPEPAVVAFDPEEIRRRRYHIDDFQSRLYVLTSPRQLYESLDGFAAAVRPLLAHEEIEVIQRSVTQNEGVNP